MFMKCIPRWYGSGSAMNPSNSCLDEFRDGKPPCAFLAMALFWNAPGLPPEAGTLCQSSMTTARLAPSLFEMAAISID
jgi:hypothetical protein